MAGSIDNLNFEIILKDDEFGKKVQEDMKLAQQLNVSLTKLLDLQTRVKSTGIKTTGQGINEAIKIERLAAAAAKRAAAEEKLTAAQTASKTAAEKLAAAAAKRAAAEQSAATATARATKGQKAMLRAVNETNKAYQNQGRVLGELKSLALQYLSIRGVSELISSLVRVTGEFELQKTTLAAMLGDLNAAENVLTKIKGLAVESPFQFKELTTYAKQLTAFAVPANELFETTKMLADVSAGLGVGMDRLVLAYGQVKSAAFLRGQEVRQFTEAGIPILNELAKQFEKLEGKAVSAGEVFDRISKRMVSFEMVNQIFKEMTSEGGKFFNMQEVQAETLKGKISNLKDAYEMMMNEIGEGQTENLKKVVDWTRKLMQNYEETGRILLELIATYGIYKTALIAIEVATNSFAIANHKLISSLVSAGKYILANPYVALAAGITAVGYAIYRNHQKLEGFQKIQKSVANTQKDYTKEISIETSKLDALYAKLKLAKKGTQEYNDAKKEIYSKYASYISQLREEGVEVNDLANIYVNLKNKIEESTRARTSSIAKQKLTETYDQEVDAYYNRYEQIIEKVQKTYKNRRKLAGSDDFADFTEFEKAGFWKFISGSMHMGDLEATSGLERVVRVLNDATVDASADLKILRKEMTKTTKEYNKSLKEIGEAYGEVSDNAEGVIPPVFDGSGDEDKAVKAIQKEISALQTLAKTYKEFKDLGVRDEAIQLNLLGYFPNIRREYGNNFITQLDYATRILQKVKELERIAPEEAYNIMTALGLDKASLEQQAIRDQNKAFEDAAKAAGNYFNTLRAWEAEDFNIQGKGIIFDVNKITSDLQGAINKIELKATKLKETFAQIIPEDFKSTIEVYAVARIKNKELAKQFRDSLKEIDSNDIASIYKLLTEQLGEQSAESIIKTAFPALDTIKESFTKEFGADAWTAFWNSFKTEGYRAIDRVADKERASEKAKSQEKLNDLARKYIKESYFNNNIKLEELGDKDYFQIRTMRKRLQDLLDQEPLTIPVDVQNLMSSVGINANELVGVDLDAFFNQMSTLGKPISVANQELLKLVQSIQKAELSTTDLGDAIKKVLKGDLKDLTKEESEALMSMIKGYMSELKSVLSSISQYAESIADDELRGAIKGLSESMSIMSNIGDKLIQGDWIGAIISGVTSLTSVILEAASAEGKLAQAIEQTKNEMILLNSQKAINKGVETFFGTDDFKKFQNAMDEAVKAHEDAIADIEKQNAAFYGRSSDDWGGAGVAGGLAAGAAVGAIVGSVIPVIGTAIGAGLGALLGAIVGAVGATATEANNYATTLKHMADSIGADLINNETGALDVQTLEKIKETYTDLDEESKEMLDKLIAHAKVYENAITEIATFMTDIFGQCAESMADSFIESFKQSGEAALEYGDLMDALATDIARSIIKSTILQNVFSEEDAKKAAIELASGNAAGAMEIVDKAIQSAEELAPYIQELLKSLEPYFNMSEESQNLADGIKGMTEDTANLLASYLNAIRADVSYAKSIWERMDKNTQAIASAIASFPIPSLMEYQAQIAANTYNTAMHTQDILFELRSVIASDGGPTAIRVLM